MLTFAIGDIHGCDRFLDGILAQIATRSGRDPHRIVCLGDYVDRGPGSAAVVSRLRALQVAGEAEVICLKGNHEDLMLRAWRDPARNLDVWLQNGGFDTLRSFGVGGIEDLPAEAMGWIDRCPTSYDDGRRLFVHAGLRPGVPLAEQRDHDRLWIREVFLDGDHDLGRFVVHGHTPRLQGGPELRRWRVNLDTGAVYGGRLSAAVFTDEADAPSEFLRFPG